MMPRRCLPLWLWLCTVAFTIAAPRAAHAATVDNLRCEYLDSPLGLDSARPRLSWIIHSTQRGDRQTAYRVLVASSPQLLSRNKGDLWDSGKVAAGDSANVEYAGRRLLSGVTACWKAQVWDKNRKSSPWSGPARFSIGLLNQADWKAQWIGMAAAAPDDCPWFRKSFTLTAVPQSALAYVGSIGFHELYVNGRKVGDRVLTPSVSDLQKRALYCT